MPIATEPNQFDFSRFKTFHICPRKHFYAYEEGIRSEGNVYTTPGTMFHKAVEIVVRNVGKVNEDLDELYKEFENLCKVGTLPYEPDLLPYVVQKYFEYYKKEYVTDETNILTEYSFHDPIEVGDVVVGVVDQVFEADGLHVLRDIKTTVNKLKYTVDDVKNNQQLLFYAAYVGGILGIWVDAIEIDEVKLAKLQPVPLLKNGQPSKDKHQLELVLLEDYEEELRAQGLFGDSSYNAVLEWLRERGHPLFNRVRFQVLDDAIIKSNLQDMYETYKLIKTGNKFRCRSPLCKSCEYKELCDLDMYNPSEEDRKIYIENITKNP